MYQVRLLAERSGTKSEIELQDRTVGSRGARGARQAEMGAGAVARSGEIGTGDPARGRSGHRCGSDRFGERATVALTIPKSGAAP